MKRRYLLKWKLYGHLVTPGFVTVLMIIVCSSNLRVPGLSEFMPFFSLMTIFFWTVYAPRVIPQWLCIFLGLLQDTVNGWVLGVSSLVYILFWGIIYSQRRFLIKENFMVLYGIFILASFLIHVVYFLLFALIVGKVFFTPSLMIQWFFTIALYPLLHLVFSNIYIQMARLYRYA